MRLPDAGTKVVVHSTLESERKAKFGQKISDSLQFKSTFDQKFSNPRQKSSCARQNFAEPQAVEKKVSNIQQTITLKPDSSDSQQKDRKTKSNLTSAAALSIPVTDNEGPKEQGECKKLEDLMSNLCVSGSKSKTRGRVSNRNTKIFNKGNDLSEKSESLNDSCKKLNISAQKNEKLVRKVKNEDEEGALIERGPVPSFRRLHPTTAHPYQQESAPSSFASYSLLSGGIVAEQPYGSNYHNHTPLIPQFVEEMSSNGSVHVVITETEDINTPENTIDILNEENVIPFVCDWPNNEIEQCDDSITFPSALDIQLPLFGEPIHGNTSPQCSMDSTYGTLSPDSNVVSPVSYTSPMPFPVYRGNDFTDETLLDEIATSSSSSSDYLPNEPELSLNLFDLIEECTFNLLDISNNNDESQKINNKYDFVGLDKPSVVGNKTQQNNQFYADNKLTHEMSHDNFLTSHTLEIVSNKLLSEVPCSNSVASPIQQTVHNTLPSEMSHINSTASHLNTKLSRENTVKPVNVGYSGTEEQFNIFTAPNVMTTTAPPEQVLKRLTSSNHIKPTIMDHQTRYIPSKSRNQIAFNNPAINNSKLTHEMSRDNFAASHTLGNQLLSEMPPHILQTVNNKSPSEMSHTSTAASHVNAGLQRVNIVKPLNEAYNVTKDQFNNFAAPNVVTTTTPPEHVLARLTSTNHVQPNKVSHQTKHILTKSNNQIPFSNPVVNTASQSMHRHNVVPVEANSPQTNNHDNSVVSFIYGDGTKKNTNKSVPINTTTRFSTTSNSMRPVEGQILSAGSEVYETGLSLPASDRLKSLMMSKDFDKQYVEVNIELVNKPELLKERLFQLLTELPKAQNWLLSICAHIALTLKIQSRASVLTATNSEGYSMLYLACVIHPYEHVIARYIADSLLELKINPDQIYDGGNSLVHLIASRGDTHVAVLEELLHIRHPLTEQPVFNVNKPNTRLETPLHIAVSRHSLPHSCLSTVKLLISHGANVAAQDENGMTPLHYAILGNCELVTVQLQSLTSYAAINITNFEHNSALHLAAANNSVSLLKQKDAILALIRHGADYRLQNIDGNVAAELFSVDRLQEIKKLLP